MQNVTIIWHPRSVSVVLQASGGGRLEDHGGTAPVESACSGLALASQFTRGMMRYCRYPPLK